MLSATLRSTDTIVLAFGRFNPPTWGHELVMDKVLEVAKDNNCDHAVITSISCNAQNPLHVNSKGEFLSKAFPDIHFVCTTTDRPSIFHMLKVYNQTYKRLIYVCGFDRASKFQIMLDKYNGIDYEFASIKVESVARPENSISASRARADARAGDFNFFRAALPVRLHTDLQTAYELYEKVRIGLGICGQPVKPTEE